MGKAAVLTGVDQPLEIRDDVEVEAPHAGEVKVRMAASGVCHSDLSMQNGTMHGAAPRSCSATRAPASSRRWATASPRVAPGDHVVISWVPSAASASSAAAARASCARRPRSPWRPAACSTAPPGSPRRGQPLLQMAASGTFSEVSIVPATGVVKIPDDVDLKVAALIGCGVLTGTGAALNTADIQPGDTVAVVGCGGVGLNVIQGARIAGAAEIIAVDMNETKLPLAKEFGATDDGQRRPAATRCPQVMALTGRARRRRRLRGHRPAADHRPDHHHDPAGRPGHPRRRAQDGRHGQPPRLLRAGAGREDDQGLLVRLVERAAGRAQADRASTATASSSWTS